MPLDVRADAIVAAIAPPSFWLPEFLDQSAWIQHAPFAFWLMGALRPRSFVELGTHGGYSYFAICQAVRRLRLETLCHAVDTWRGDEHAGFYGEEVLQRVRQYHDTHYADFSRLIRATFAEALAEIPDASVDLLHIDGRHFYEDVKADFESWTPKLSSRAVVLFHDTNVRDRDFGVFRLWDELKARYPSFEFLHGHGLGVLGFGAALPDEVRDFLALGDSKAAVEIRSAYSRLGGGLTALLEIETAAAERTIDRAEQARHSSGLAERIGALQDDLKQSERRRDKAEAAVQAVTERLADVRRRHGENLHILADLRRQQETLREQVEQWHSLRQSWPWRFMSPLRRIDRLLKRLGETSPRPVKARKDRGLWPRLRRSINKRYRRMKGLPPFPRKSNQPPLRQANALTPGATAAWVDVVEAYCPTPGRNEVALFVTHSRDGRTIRPHVERYVQALEAEGIDVILIVASDSPRVVVPADLARLLAGLYIRQNVGFDFAAWSHVMQIEPSVFSADGLYIINDSLYGPFSQKDFSAIVSKIRASESDIVGLTESLDKGWHLQSFFVCMKRRALSNPKFHAFWRDVRSYADKQEVIDLYEVTFSGTMRDAGLVCSSLFRNDTPSNMMIDAWRELIELGLPFVKASVLKGDIPPSVSIDGWEALLTERGYDVALVDLPPSDPWAVVADLSRARRASPDARRRTGVARRRLAFFGPWNYAEASRGYVSALFHTGHDINLHPVKCPLGTLPRTAPTWDVRGFDGPADAALIHIAPTSMASLLREDQKTVCGQAAFRIGLWAQDALDVSDDWNRALDHVDAIWVPDSACAEAFQGHTDLPVHVIGNPPSTVKTNAGEAVPPSARTVAEAMMASLDLLLPR